MTSAFQWKKKLNLKELPDVELIALLEAARDDLPNQETQKNAQILEDGFSSQDVIANLNKAITEADTLDAPKTSQNAIVRSTARPKKVKPQRAYSLEATRSK